MLDNSGTMIHDLNMNKTFQVEKKGKRIWVVVRQASHDPQYKIGSHIPSYGKVVAIREEQN